MKIEDECIENVDVGNKSNTLSISLSNFENVVHTNRKENSSEYSVINIAQKNNTEEGINSANNKSKEKIVPTSLDGENQMSDSKENFHELLDLQNGTECRNNLVKKIKRKSLEVCKFGSFNLTKSNIRNDKVIDKETGLRNCLFHYLKNILTPSSWRVLISYLLVFLFGFYAMSGFFINEYKRWATIQMVVIRRNT
ncbi:hypothetical protein M0804_000870 [Polistes exclamans]|nr:hypothetical protein M0804_000870 [Polistes exclamans]